MNKLPFKETLIEACQIGLKNILSLIAVTVLYLVTIWIPYLNVGTTIAVKSIPAELAKGHIIDPLFIFDGKYRKNMGEFFILMTLMYGAIGIGYLFGGIPAIVLSVAWSLATVLFIDKDMNALEALRESNRLTYGNKWRIFGAEALVAIALCVAMAIVSGLFGIGHIKWLEAIGTIIVIVIAICFFPTLLGIEASIYKQLTSGEIIDAAPEVVPAPAPAPEAPKAEAPKAEKKAEK